MSIYNREAVASQEKSPHLSQSRRASLWGLPRNEPRPRVSDAIEKDTYAVRHSYWTPPLPDLELHRDAFQESGLPYYAEHSVISKIEKMQLFLDGRAPFLSNEPLQSVKGGRPVLRLYLKDKGVRRLIDLNFFAHLRRWRSFEEIERGHLPVVEVSSYSTKQPLLSDTQLLAAAHELLWHVFEPRGRQKVSSDRRTDAELPFLNARQRKRINACIIALMHAVEKTNARL